ncbi:MAG: hypothetical protein NZ942_03285, partial [Candidatus Aenigmarchaeota archaeon]|nr:hypothetical protein [Candidatus Aenigmarchaeota archaeon]
REVFTTEQAEVLEELFNFLDELVKVHDFNELKSIVSELAEAQKRTEKRLEELAQAQKELAQAQKKTEERLEELAQAQKKTEEEIRKLAEAQRRTEESLKNLRKDYGGFTLTYSYAFENEAYRVLPKFLKEKYQIEITERFIRTEIRGEEINFLAKGKLNGKEIYVIGEAKLRFDDTKKDFERTFKGLKRKVEAVKREYGEVEVVKLIVTHFAKPRALKLAQEKGIIVIQSFEW